MDETTTLVVVGAVVLLVGMGRLLVAMLGGGTGRLPRAGFRRPPSGGARGDSVPGGRVRSRAFTSIGRVGRLADDEVRRGAGGVEGGAGRPPGRGGAAGAGVGRAVR